MKNFIGIIGFGNMGSAIAQRIKSEYDVYVFDIDREKTKGLKDITASASIVNLVNSVGVIILAVKPQDFDTLLEDLRDSVGDKLIISIAAGITTGYIEKKLGKVRAIRVMSNIGARIGEAESCLCRGKFCDDEDLNFVQGLFNRLGKTWKIGEEMMDSSTAIIGSGPAYIFYDMERNSIAAENISEETKQGYISRLTKAAERVGFDSKIAMDLAVNTSASSIHLLKTTGMSPSQLRQQVTSKGGTTEAAIKVLAKGGSWEEAALAAKEHAKALSKKE